MANRNDLRRQHMRRGIIPDARQRYPHTGRVIPNTLVETSGEWVEHPRIPGFWLLRGAGRLHVCRHEPPSLRLSASFRRGRPS